MTSDERKLSSLSFFADIYLRASHIHDQAGSCGQFVKGLKDCADRCGENREIDIRGRRLHVHGSELTCPVENFRGIDAENADARHVFLQGQGERAAHQSRSVNDDGTWKASFAHLSFSIRRHSSMTRSKMRRSASSSSGPWFCWRMFRMICCSRSGSKTSILRAFLILPMAITHSARSRRSSASRR